MTKYKKLLSNSVIFAIGNFSVKLVQFLLMPLLTYYLTVEEFGVNDVIMTVVELAIPILTLGISDSLFRFTLEKNASKNEIFSNGILVIVTSSIIVALIAPIAYVVTKQQYILLVLPLLIVYIIKKQLAEFVRGCGNTIIYSVSNIIETITLFIASICFLKFLDMGIAGYLISLVLGAFIALIFLLIAVNPFKYFKLHNINMKYLKEMIVFSLPNVPNMISWWLVQTSSKYILIAFTGMSIASMYMAASKIPALINVVSTVFMQAWSLSSAEESNSEDRNYFYSTIFKYFSFIIILAVATVICLTPYISMFLLQGEFYDAWNYSILLILSAGIGCFSSFYGAFYSAFYNTKANMYTTFIGAGFNIVLSLSLIPFMGVYGAMIGNLVSYIAILVARVISTRKYVKIDANWFKIIGLLLLILVQALLYTFKFEYSYIYSIILIILILACNVREIKELLSKFIALIKSFKNKSIESEAK